MRQASGFALAGQRACFKVSACILCIKSDICEPPEAPLGIHRMQFRNHHPGGMWQWPRKSPETFCVPMAT